MSRTWKNAAILPDVVALFLALCLAACADPAMGADEEDPLPSALHPRARALEFEPRISFSPSATISAKYHLTGSTAVRLGFVFDFENQGTSGEDREYRDSLVETGGTHQDLNHHRVTAFLHMLRYGSLGHRFGVFGFAGPTALRDRHSEQSEFQSTGYGYGRHDETLTWGVGLDAGAGFEWFFSRRLSLGARYGITYLYTEFKTVLEAHEGSVSFPQVQIRESRGHEFDLVSTPAVLLLSGYF
jgi:hypothetical protein